MSEPPQLRLEPDGVKGLQAEFDNHLRRGGCFIPGQTSLAATDFCVLVLVHPLTGAVLELPATAVWVSPEPPGVGIELEGFSEALRNTIAEFISQRPAESAAVQQSDEADAAKIPIQQRLRKISTAEAIKLARGGHDPTERMLLERIYGKAVWAALLTNPRLTVPEVTRLARMRNMPIPLIEQIASNATWVRSPQIRRALLTNIRLSKAMITKVLSMLPRNELKIAQDQTAYSAVVRQAARRLMAK
jgi:hypothetical protein